jgi:tetratricopeptide (TPR) repeat protein
MLRVIVLLILLAVPAIASAQAPTVAEFERSMRQRPFAGDADARDFAMLRVSASLDGVIGAATSLIERGSATPDLLAYAYIRRGDMQRLRQQHPAALRDYEAAVALGGAGAAFAHVRLAEAFAPDDFRRALEHYEQAIAVNPSDPYAYTHYALLQRRRSNADVLPDMDRIVAAAPERASVYLLRSQIHRARDDHPAAVADFVRALARADEKLIRSVQAALKRQALFADEEDGIDGPALRAAVAVCLRTPGCQPIRADNAKAAADRP